MQQTGILGLFPKRQMKPSDRLRRWATRASILLATFAMLANGQEASAKNLELLMRYLIPVFLIQNFTATCRINDPAFLSELPHGASTVDEMSEQMKREITDGLTDDDAKTVVLVAANTALKASRDAQTEPRIPETSSRTALSMVP